MLSRKSETYSRRNGYTLMLMGGEELQISRPRKKAFMSELAEAMGRDNVL